MTKTFISLVLLLFIFLNTLALPLIYLDFEARRDYISKVLCINRTKPMTICGGKCYLAAQLNKTKNQQDQQQSQSNTLIAINFFFYQAYFGEIERFESMRINVHLGYLSPAIKDAPLTAIFQPPRQKDLTI